MIFVDIGVFAHDEQETIARAIGELDRQDIFAKQDFSVRVYILANGCTDSTAHRAREAIAALGVEHQFQLVELAQGGKSRTWNAFVHEISRREAHQLIYCDADLEIPNADMLSRFSRILVERADLDAAVSRPVKDIVYRPAKLSAVDRLIAAGAGTLNDWRTAIAGSLYSLRSSVARTIHLPIGLPVEDGFVRAMVLTRLLSEPDNIKRIDGIDDLFHVYASERGIGALIRHQTRLVIGGSINAALFAHLGDQPKGSVQKVLAEAAQSEKWLSTVLAERLPRWPDGWVPIGFLTKRVAHLRTGTNEMRWTRRIVVGSLGFLFDLVVFVSAQIKMARGTGIGYW